MPINFTKNDLTNLAGNTVFGRGLDYFQSDAVSEIKTVADKYTAKVYGSRVYTVEYSPDEDAFSCNCPYNGFCKHSVAFGLKLMAEQEQLPTTQDFEKWFNGIDNELKLSFLERLVQDDTTLKEKLDKMNKRAGNNDPVGINDIAGAVYGSISALSYDDVLDRESGYNYYVEEYEMIDDLVNDTLDDYLDEVEELRRNNKPEQAFDYILGIYLGLQKSKETEIGDYMDGFESFLTEQHSKYTESLAHLTDELKLKILNRFIEFCKSNPVSSFYFFKGLLSQFVTGKHSNTLKQFLMDYSDDDTAKQLLMQIAEPEKDIVLMENLLENSDSASLYIPYLNLLKANSEFEKIKQILLKFSGHHSICALERFVVPELGVETYKNLLLVLIKKCFGLGHYKNYRNLLSVNEKQKFLSGLKNNILYSTVKYALPVLFYEKIYEPVLSIISDSVQSDYGFDSYNKYLKEIAKTMPDEVWDTYFKRVEYLIDQRKRDMYRSMTIYLQIMKKISEDKTKKLILSYYNRKPVLPALRDEFNKAGIV